MKITFVLPGLGEAGGIRVISIYAHAMKQRGHDVQIVILPPRPRSLSGLIRWGLKGFPSCADPNDKYFAGGEIPITWLGAAEPLTNRRVPDADVVIATWWETAAPVARLKRSKGAKVYYMQDYGALGQEIERLRRTWRLPFYFITISSPLVSLIHSANPRARVTLAPCTVDTSVFTAPPRGKQASPRIGVLYRFMPSKGGDIALRAFEIARETRPDLELVMVSYENPPEEIPPGASFRQGASDAELRDIYAQCDAWLFPSRMEGFGLPIVEAMACRTPVISTPVGAAPDLLGEGEGVIVPHDDPQAMAEAILRVVNLSEGEWKRLSDAAFERVQSYRWSDAADKFEQGLYEAVRAGGPALDGDRP